MANDTTGVLGENEPFVLAQHLSKTFTKRDGSAAVEAVGDVSLSADSGELVSLLGPSGCGKTTVLRMVAGLTEATGGTVRVRGREVTEPQPDFGMVFQTPVLLPWRNAISNVLFPMEILGAKNSASIERAERLLVLVGLEGFTESRPAELSGGMQQRVALCRGLIHDPTLLLMDEPFGALDELTRIEMNDLLLKIREATRKTVIFVTHGISEAIYLSDRVLVFSKRPSRIVEEIHIPFTYPRDPEIRYTNEFSQLALHARGALGMNH